VIVLAGTIRIPPENLDRARPDLEAMVQITRKEPGCLAYSFSFDVVEQGLVRVFEVFSNAEALAAHQTSPHMAAFRTQRETWGMFERNMTQYEISSFKKI
jgi:quinol monooxygenase YgiN